MHLRLTMKCDSAYFGSNDGPDAMVLRERIATLLRGAAGKIEDDVSEMLHLIYDGDGNLVGEAELMAAMPPNLYYVAASIDGEAHSGDLFVRAYTADEARAWWRGYYDADDDTGIEKIDEIPLAATTSGPIRWEDVPEVYRPS